MAGIFGQLQPFKEGETWQEYVEIFENKFIANDIDNDKEKKKCAFCVQMLGQRLTTLSKQKLSQLFVISSGTILNPNFMRLVLV